MVQCFWSFSGVGYIGQLFVLWVTPEASPCDSTGSQAQRPSTTVSLAFQPPEVLEVTPVVVTVNDILTVRGHNFGPRPPALECAGLREVCLGVGCAARCQMQTCNQEILTCIVPVVPLARGDTRSLSVLPVVGGFPAAQPGNVTYTRPTLIVPHMSGVSTRCPPSPASP